MKYKGKKKQKKEDKMKQKGIRSRKTSRIIGCFLIASVLLVSTLPEMTLAATPPTEAELKAKIAKQEQNIKDCTAQLARDEQAYEDARAAIDEAVAKRDWSAAQLERTKLSLDKIARAYADDKIKAAWKAGDKEAFAKDNSSRFIIEHSDGTITYDNAYEQFLSANRVADVKSSSSYNSIVSAYEKKYGTGTFDRAYTSALGYHNMMRALELLDECNSIRASREELAKYYVNVKGVPVPANVPQLRISPYMMTGSAMCATLVSCQDPTGHIYSAGSLGGNGHDQIIQSVQRSDDRDTITIADPYCALWSSENARKMQSHNSAIADEDYTATGIAIINPNPYKSKAVFCQDFTTLDISRWNTYSVEEYRDGLVKSCKVMLTIYNISAADYNRSCEAYRNAVTAQNDAFDALQQSKKELLFANSYYNSYKREYESLYGNKPAATQPSTQKPAATQPSTQAPKADATVLKKPVIKKVRVKKTSATVTLKSAGTGCKYQYQVRKVGKSKWTSKKSAKTTVTFKKLKKNSKYKVRARVYKKINGTTKYGPWRTVTVKTTKKGSKTYKY